MSEMQKANLSFLTKLQAALAIYDVPDTARVLILSTSHWSHIVDWQKAKANGVAGGIVKFMDGKDQVKYAEENYRGIVDAGLLPGGYTWLHRANMLSPGAAAREYLAFLKDHPCRIRPAVDFEWTADGNPYFDDLYGFAMPFADGYGKYPMVYTAPGYWNDPALIAKGSKLGPMDPFWLNLPLWGAEYRTKGVFNPFGPWRSNFKMFQFTATLNSALYGYPPDGEKEAEGNYWTGTQPDLVAWCDGATPTPVPVPTPGAFNGASATVMIAADGTWSLSNQVKL